MHINAVQQAYGVFVPSDVADINGKPSPVKAKISGSTNADTVTISPAAKGALSLADEIKTSFRSWKAEVSQNKNISEEMRQQVEKYSTSFEQIIDKAVVKSGYDNPQDFLQSLSVSDLKTLQHIHGLADPISPNGLSREGALNLLLSPDKQQDIDNDGYTMSGLAKRWDFPPANAPEYVKKAWKETTANMSEFDVFDLQSNFAQGTIEGGANPSTENAYISPDASYSDIVKTALDGAKFSLKFAESWQIDYQEKQIKVLETFLDNLLSSQELIRQ